MRKIKNISVSLFLSILLLFNVSPACYADDVYDVNAALKYAREHWNDEKTNGPDKTWCAGFVSHCLIKGKVKFSPETDVIGKRVTFDEAFNAYMYHGCWGLFHDLKNRPKFTEVNKLTTDESGRIPWDLNVGKVAKGDILFCHIKGAHSSDTDQYHHVVLVGNEQSAKDPFIRVYAHNYGLGNEATCICRYRDPNHEVICVHFKHH